MWSRKLELEGVFFVFESEFSCFAWLLMGCCVGVIGIREICEGLYKRRVSIELHIHEETDSINGSET